MNELAENEEIEEVEEAVGAENALTENTDTAEEQAGRMGWKPEDEYKGREGEWVDAEAFLDKTENDPAQLKRSLKTIERNYAKLEKGMDAVVAHQEREVEAARQKAINETRAEREANFVQAVEDGDSETAQRLYKEREAPEAVSADDRVVAWRKSNTWMDTDPVMTDAANRYADTLATGGEPIDTMLEKTTAYMKKRFPDEFPRDPRAATPVTGGNRGNVVTPKSKAVAGSYEALSPEGRSQCDNFVREYKRTKGWNESESKAAFMAYAQQDPTMFN